MLFTKSILSLVSLALLLSVVGRVQGDGTMDESCPNELAAYQGCANSNQATCETACENVNVEEPNLSAEDMLSMMTDPNFICNWLNDLMCSIQQCCNPCIIQANAYFACVAAESSENGSCSLVCSDGDGSNGDSGTVDDGSDGAVDDGSDTGGAVEGGSDNGGAVDDGSDTGGAVDEGSEAGGAVEGGNGSASSASPAVSMTMGWMGVAMGAGYALF